MTFYQQIPKIELHLHLEGAIPLPALWQLIQKYGGDPNITNYSDLESRFTYSDFDHFIETWIWKNSFLREYEDFLFISEHVAGDLASQNIRYAEIFVSPSAFKQYGLTGQEIIHSVHKGINKVKEIKIGLIVDFVRNNRPEQEMKTLYEINEVREYDVIGIGLGGSENHYPPEPFTGLFEKAREFGFKTTAHAGEAAGPASVRGAIQSLKVDRIGHATRSAEDVDLLKYLSENRIPLELCPISNLKTGAISSYKDYPINTFIEYQIPFSINTDDPKMFGNSLAEEYKMLEHNFNFSKRDVTGFIIDSIQTTWLSDEEKDLLTKQFKDEISAMN
jgi:adenosine deaminase